MEVSPPHSSGQRRLCLLPAKTLLEVRRDGHNTMFSGETGGERGFVDGKHLLRDVQYSELIMRSK
jgi:hypothetical protein